MKYIAILFLLILTSSLCSAEDLILLTKNKSDIPQIVITKVSCTETGSTPRGDQTTLKAEISSIVELNINTVKLSVLNTDDGSTVSEEHFRKQRSEFLNIQVLDTALGEKRFLINSTRFTNDGKEKRVLFCLED